MHVNRPLIIPSLKGRGTANFFKAKPTFRKLTSQHPYAERYVGTPQVQSVNLNDNVAVENALKFMKNNTVSYQHCFYTLFCLILALLLFEVSLEIVQCSMLLELCD